MEFHNTGFQGINPNSDTTIGRGGSDASAIMLLNFLKQKNVLYIPMWTDLYNRSKLYLSKKKKNILRRNVEMASLGAKVMQPHSIQDARLIESILKFVIIQKCSGSLLLEEKY